MKLAFEILIYLLAAYGLYSVFIFIKGKNYEAKIKAYLDTVKADMTAKDKSIEQHLKDFIKSL